MRHLVKKFYKILLCVLVFSSQILALDSEICFEFELISASALVSSKCPKNNEYAELNNIGIMFYKIYEKTENDVVVYTQNRGCLDKKHLLEGLNQIKVNAK
jgi:hypothetical protein